MSDQPISSDRPTDHFRLFILRVWQDKPGDPQRFMLKAADNDHRHVFADVHSLADFLQKTAYPVEEEI